MRKILLIMMMLLLGGHAHSWPSDMPFNPNNLGTVNFDQTVRFGKNTTYALGGLADYSELAKYLAPMGLRPLKNIFGKAQLALNFSRWSDVIGCGCPERFDEFMITIEAVSMSGTKVRQMVPDFVVSSDPLRVISLVGKFGLISQPGHFSFDSKAFSVKSADGKIHVYLQKDSLPRKFLFKNHIDFNFVTFGVAGRETVIGSKQFRISGPTRSAISLPFSFKPSHLKIARNSELDLLLKRVRFKPLMWQVHEFSDSWAWLH